MNFDLNEEQREIQRAASEFANGEFDKKVALDLERNHQFPFAILKKACQLGFIGIHFPEEYGGQGYGILENALIVEAFCRRDSGIGVCLSIANFSSEIILRFGNEAQKKKYLVPITQGEAISAGAFTEPDHGSDITQLRTTAVRDGNEYLINGVKTFISNGTIAHFVIVLCQSDPQVKPTYRGQSTFIVEKGSKGFEVSELGEKMGIKMTSTTEMSFDHVRVPEENLIGNLHKGFYQVIEFFDESRVMVAAQALGIAQGAFDRALDYAKKRKQFGQKLVDFQVTQHKLADMATQIEAARCLVYKAGWNFDQGRIEPKWTSMAKMVAGRVAVEVAQEAIQIHGGYGYMLEYEVERFYRDARIMEIYEGTREIQKNTIASSVVGKKG
ncbi:MAG: acyl-CoA dehydrogenase family protein [Thermodesulfobacteriota bacterium]